MGKAFGDSMGAIQEKYNDRTALDDILDNASKSTNPNALTDAMGQILNKVSPAMQGKALEVLKYKYEGLQAQKKQEKELAQKQSERQAKINAGFDADLPNALAKDVYKGQQKDKRLANVFGDQSGDMQQNSEPSENPFANFSDDKLVALSGHPDREVSEPSKQELKRRQQLAKGKKPGDEFAKIREKNVSNYVNNALASRETAEDFKFSIDQARQAIQGDVAGPGVTALAKNNPYTAILVGLTPDESTLLAANKKLLEGSKGIFGSKPTEKEIFLLLNSMLPSIGKTKEANLAGLNFIERVNDMKLMHSEIVDELTEGGTKYVPDLERQVNAQMRPYGEALRRDLSQAVEALNSVEPNQKNGKIKVKGPDGKTYKMTQDQINAAAKDKVIFEPVK